MGLDRNANNAQRLRRNAQRLRAGDVTASIGVDNVTIQNTGTSIRVKDLGISTAKLADNGVTIAKFQQITTSRLIGRQTAATGNVEQLTVAGGIEFTTGGIQTSAFTGDATKAAGGTVLTLATVNSNLGTFNNITINAKGLATAGSNVAYLTANQTITLSGDVTGSGTTAITATLATVNSNVGTFNTVTVNGKGLVTAASNAAYVTNLFTNTADSTSIANTLTETTISISYTVPANYLTAGKMIRLTAWGRYSASGTPALTIRAKLGAVVLVPTSQGVFNNAANRSWRVDATFLCTVAGASGTVHGNSLGNIQDASNLITMHANNATVDTTAANTLSITMQWGTASASNTILANAFVVEGG
jgi:hypothetical protein